MHTFLTVFTLVFLVIAIVSLAFAFLNYQAIIYKLKRKYPKYYLSIGQPSFMPGLWKPIGYVSMYKRLNAWLEYLRILYTKPKSFPKDNKLKLLAKRYRQTMRMGLVAFFICLPSYYYLVIKYNGRL